MKNDSGASDATTDPPGERGSAHPTRADGTSETPGPENAIELVEYGEDPMQVETTQLMTAVRAGDERAFDALMRCLRGRAFHVAQTLVGSREDAMELCQEAFLKVFKARASYDSSQPFLPWFHRILRNTCFSFLRKNKRLKKHSLSATDEAGDELGWEIVDPGPAPGDGVLREERSELFRQALERLKGKDREILALRHFDELSYREIARTLDIPEGTVMSRLYHARRKLRDALAPLLGELEQTMYPGE